MVEDVRGAFRDLLRGFPLTLLQVASVTFGLGLLLPFFGLFRLHLREPPRVTSLFELEPTPSGALGLAWTQTAATPGEIRSASLGELEIVLLSLTVLTLVIVCLNLVCLGLQRTLSRRHETVMQLALGLSRRRLRRRFLIEAGAISLLGVGSAWLVAPAIAEVLEETWPVGLLPPGQNLVSGSLVFLVSVTVFLAPMLTSLLFVHFIPRFPLASRRVQSTEVDVGGLLIVFQMGALLMVLIGTGLLTTTFVPRTVSSDPGFHPSEAFVIRVAHPGGGEGPSDETVWERLADSQQLAGVSGVGIITPGGLVGLGVRDRVVAQCDCAIGGMLAPFVMTRVMYSAISPGLFKILGVPILSGREFTATDGRSSQPVALVNRTFAARQLRGVDPIGKRMLLGRTSFAGPWYEIVGVVGDIRPSGIGTAGDPSPSVYLSALQHPPTAADLVIRLSGSQDAASLEGLLAATIGQSDGEGWTVREVLSLEEVLLRFYAPLRWMSLIWGVLAAVSLALGLMSVYSATSYQTQLLQWELGVRQAVGASQRAIFLFVLIGVLRQAGIGVILGVIGGAGLARTLQLLLQGVPAFDLRLAAGLGILLTLTALGGAFFPARRASAHEPGRLLSSRS